MATVKLGEKPIVETIGDSDHVIAEIGGNIRRVPAANITPPATASALGGVKADAAQSTDTQPVRIGADNKLYTAPSASDVPVIDLASLGVVLSAASDRVTIPESTGEQIKAAAMADGAIVKIGFAIDGLPFPLQGYCSGAAIDVAKSYQLSGRFYFKGGISVFLILQNSMTSLSLEMVPDPDPLPEPDTDGDFLRARNGAWVAEPVPAAEEASF